MFAPACAAGAAAIGQKMERATLIAEDPQRDTALLRVESPRSASRVRLETSMAPIGTSCGALGFPLAEIVSSPTGPSLSLAERFQGANISAFHAHPNHSGQPLDYYETDAAMYGGSSGCPGFLMGGKVFGMHIASVLAQGRAAENPQPMNGGPPAGRYGISIWVAAREIALFAQANGLDL